MRIAIAAQSARVRRAAVAASVAAVAVVAGGSAGDVVRAPAQDGGAELVHVATTGFGAERVKSIPIARRAKTKQRAVISLGAGEIGRIESGDRVEGKAELEVSTTCLERLRGCVGRIYHFSPFVQARLVLTGGPRATSGVPVSRWRTLRCEQRLPHRNHHCVIVIPTAEKPVENAGNLPCEGQRCHLNLVLSAHHSSAKPGHRLVIGTDDPGGVSQNKGHVAVAVYRPGQARSSASVLTQRRPRLRRLDVGGFCGGCGSQRVVISRRLDDLRVGERLVVEAGMRGGIAHLRYANLVQSRLVLSRRPRSTKRKLAANVGSFRGRFGMQNGFNCTQGRSAHDSPCRVRKVGVMRIIRDARMRPLRREGKRGPEIPLYVNLVVGARAVGVHGHRRRSGDRMRIRGASIKIRRYPG